MKPTILFFYDYFYPGYKAGGPIQSLTNLAAALSQQYKVSVITSCHDLGSEEIYKDVAINLWNEISITESSNVIQVYYADHKLDKKVYDKLFKEIKPDVCYFNNVYSYQFFRLPLSRVKKAGANSRIVVCPRGMLQRGALAVKPFKKKVYLNYLRFTGSLDNTYWHATNGEEAADIKKHFRQNKGIVIARNIPKPPVETIFYPAKEQGQLRLVFLSLIAEKKNVLFLLQLLKAVKEEINLDIYGPVTDKAYWRQCMELIQEMPGKVCYKGEVLPNNVQHFLSQYHAFISLTKGENFGHALYESLSVGRPVITSHFTPWNELQQKKAGINADINDINDCTKKILQFTHLNQEDYNTQCKNAHRLAIEYYNNLDTENSYKQLFL